MSLKTWKEEFYPIEPSSTFSKKEAIEHSILKWTGLLPENMSKHNLQVRVGSIIDIPNAESLSIDTTTCALCRLFYIEDDNGDICEDCPLMDYLDMRCDDTENEDGSPYGEFCETGNPEKMISSLRGALNLFNRKE